MAEKRFSIGVPKEIKTDERRVGVTPFGVKHLRSKKIRVIIEKGAGKCAGYTDRMYLNAGAILVPEAGEVWKHSDIIMKVKEPQPEEFRFFEKKHILFTFLHLSSHKESHLVKALLKAGATAIGYETIHRNSDIPILKPMSEIAGYLAGYFACYIQTKVKLRAGQIIYPASYQKDLLAIEKNFPKLKFPAFNGNVLVLGGGTVGYQAAIAMAHTKAHIWITEKNAERYRYLKRTFQKSRENIIAVDAQDRSIPALMNKAHVVIGAVYILGRRAPILIDEQMLHDASYHHPKLVIDVAIDQGGNVFGTHPTA
ncbi:MAG: alanine dehydrogenase [Candidatus Omnitrophica bacterium]|nr:alanine dehydrogenase [Candidatus Omnitrophota bacterium]